MENLKEILSSPDEFKTLSKTFDRLLKAKKFDELEKLLLKYSSQDSSHFRSLYLKITSQSVYFDSSEWTKLLRDIVFMDEGQDKVAALGFDLTGHWEGNSPGFETSCYENKICENFSFSHHTPDALLKISGLSTPWQGSFINCDDFGPINGLDALYQALCEHNRSKHTISPQAEPKLTISPDQMLGFFLGQFFLHLHVQRTFARELLYYGLPRRMPVLLGTHDFIGEYDAHNVISSETIAQNLPELSALKADSQDHQRTFIKERVEHNISRCIKAWITLHQWHDQDHRHAKHLVETSIFDIESTLSHYNVKSPKPLIETTQQEFKSLLEEYYQANMREI